MAKFSNVYWTPVPIELSRSFNYLIRFYGVFYLPPLKNIFSTLLVGTNFICLFVCITTWRIITTQVPSIFEIFFLSSVVLNFAELCLMLGLPSETQNEQITPLTMLIDFNTPLNLILSLIFGGLSHFLVY